MIINEPGELMTLKHPDGATYCVASPPKPEIIMTIPNDGPSELLAKFKATQNLNVLVEYLEQLERALACMGRYR